MARWTSFNKLPFNSSARTWLAPHAVCGSDGRAHTAVAEAAAVGRPDELKGQALCVFVTLKPGHAPDDAMRKALGEQVAHEIGKFVRPDDIRFADGLPKTRSGKIMRRLLKDVAAGRETQGDISTLEDLNVLAKLRADEE